ncbi:polyketide synthase [Streptomyces sp. SID5785]|nr:polyketide synthase [Streptomyces sp. SID5785]
METIRSLREQLDAERSAGRVAVVGAGLRAPGGLSDREAYWQALAQGRTFLSELPQERRAAWAPSWDGLLSRGGYLDDVLGFDARFFGISPREARGLDPQHRLLLEVVWEAFEDAAVLPAAVAESTGVFVGITGQDYRHWGVEEPNSSWLIGNGHCFAAGRLAYTLGFQGPALAVDTACSSSLVALHTACRSLAARDCDTAVVAGVNLVLSPRSTAEIQRTEALSPDGRCRPFDARANGFVRGEGCGAVLLKRLADAERDGDRVLAVIEATRVNQDGRSSGFTAPNVLAQTKLIESVLADAGATAADVGYLEAHGTGTPLGDPIELEAAGTALGRPGAPWYVGSVKANIGHTEAAAGVLGLIKAVMSLHKREIPVQAEFDTLNPRITGGDGGPTVPTRTLPWPESGGRCAAVSSFGMSGTNAHALLSPAPARTAPRPGEDTPVAGFMVSAHTQEALRTSAARYAKAVQATEGDYPAFAYTATHGRTRLPHAVWVAADGVPDAVEALTALADGRDDPRVSVLGPDTDLPVPAGARTVTTVPSYPWQRSVYSIRPVGPAADPAGA